MRLILPLIVILSTLAFPAFAQQQCGPKDVVTQALGQKYGEAPVTEGISEGAEGKPGPLLVLFGSEHGETWTLVGVMPNGMACLLMSGTDLQSKPWVRPENIGQPS